MVYDYDSDDDEDSWTILGLGRGRKAVRFAGSKVEAPIFRKLGRTGGMKRNAQELIRTSRGQTISLR